MTPPSGVEVVRKLRARPGPGGVRLSYPEARLALEMIEAGALAVQKLRETEAALRACERHRLLRSSP